MLKNNLRPVIINVVDPMHDAMDRFFNMSKNKRLKAI